MKHILIPTDFSPEADSAREAARSLALKSGAELHFLHVLEPVSGYGFNFSGPNDEAGLLQVYQMKLIEQATQQLKKVALSSEFMGITTHYETRVDDIYKAVLEYSKEKHIDLIVMGSKGISGLEEVLIGSNAERIVRLSNAPVLVIKKSVPDFDVKKIAYATNLEANVDKVVAGLKSFQEAFGAEIMLVNINTPNNFYRTRSILTMLENFAKRHHLTNYTTHVYSDTSEEEGIIYFAEDYDADVIVMGTHGRTGFSHLLSGSLAEDVVNHSSKPVLTIKMK